MPIYEFECAYGHRFEKIMSISAMQEIKKSGIPCEGNRGSGFAHLIGGEFGNGRAYLAISLPAQIRTPEDSRNNFVYFENKKGEVEWTSTPNIWHPRGYERKEARNHFERLKVESKLRRQDDERLEKQYESNDARRHYSEATRHSELNAAISSGALAIDNPDSSNPDKKETVYLDEKTKNLLKKGMQHSINRKPKRRHSEFRLANNHQDSSTIKGEE